jgi:hypothetical protein
MDGSGGAAPGGNFVAWILIGVAVIGTYHSNLWGLRV